jgi:hypothetical protein
MQISASSVIKGDLETVWDIETDVNRWPSWDPHEEDARFEGPFAVGTKGWSKPRGGPEANWVITAVEKPRRWALDNPVFGGKLEVEKTYEAVDSEHVRCTKTMVVKGILVPLFWLYFAKITKRDMFLSWEALEKEVDRVRNSQGR